MVPELVTQHNPDHEEGRVGGEEGKNAGQQGGVWGGEAERGGGRGYEPIHVALAKTVHWVTRRHTLCNIQPSSSVPSCTCMTCKYSATPCWMHNSPHKYACILIIKQQSPSSHPFIDHLSINHPLTNPC